MVHEVKDIRKAYNRLGLGMLAYMMICQLLPLVPDFLIKAYVPNLYNFSWYGILRSELIQFLIALPIAVMIMKSAKAPRIPLQKKRLTIGKFISYLFLSIGLMFLFNLVGMALNEWISIIKGSPAANIVEQSISSSSLLQLIVTTVILAPIGEELLFRKFIYESVGAFGEKAYVLTSAATFMLMHGNVIQYPYAFVVGLVFAWIYLKTGSLWNTILLHAVVNAIGGVLPFLGMDKEVFIIVQVLIDLFAAAYAVGLTIQKRYFRLKNQPQLPEQALDAVLLNPGMMLFTMASLIMAGCIILYL